jgi:hypothetical protein
MWEFHADTPVSVIPQLGNEAAVAPTERQAWKREPNRIKGAIETTGS